MMRGDDNKAGSGTNGVVETLEDAGEIVAITEDAGEVMIDPPALDAGSASAGNSEEQDQIRLDCKAAADKRNWNDLLNCTERLKAYEPDKAKTLREMAVRENQAEPRVRDLASALRDENFKQARSELDRIPKGSVYRKQAELDVEAAEKSMTNRLVAKANAAKDDDEKCIAYNRFIGNIKDGQGQRIYEAVRRQTRCAPKVAANPNPNPNPVVKCDADAAKERAQDAFASGSYTVAHNQFEAAYKCRQEASVAQKAFISACNLRSLAKAKRWWKVLPPNMQTQAVSICVRNQITREELDR
jgi:hypothetical protein